MEWKVFLGDLHYREIAGEVGEMGSGVLQLAGESV